MTETTTTTTDSTDSGRNAFVIGQDFTQEQIDNWTSELSWWIGKTMPSIKKPEIRAQLIMTAALKGTKLNGDPWPNVSPDFYKRVIQLGNYDIKKKQGVKRVINNREKRIDALRGNSKQLDEMARSLPEIPPDKAIELKEQYKKDLIDQYPHLSSKVYEPKVSELAEVTIKSRMLSNDFMAATGKQLELLNKLRESLHKQIGTLMDFLEISPKLMAARYKDSENTNVGSLVARLESYGELWQEYERIDSLRELIQKYKQLNSTRPDGTPQLNDWELWHQTRNRPVNFTCKCGESYLLLGGFTPEEIEKALTQAQETYGFGLEEIGSSAESTDSSTDITKFDLDFDAEAVNNEFIEDGDPDN